jgi:hypothetical protein
VSKNRAARDGEPPRSLRAALTALRLLAAFEPLALAGARLEVRSDAGDVLAGRDHGGAHLVAVGVDC